MFGSYVPQCFSTSLYSILISPYLRHLHSFPTRRSSDLPSSLGTSAAAALPRKTSLISWPTVSSRAPSARRSAMSSRSEEHTSELQSRENIVCRLLLEKK